MASCSDVIVLVLFLTLSCTHAVKYEDLVKDVQGRLKKHKATWKAGHADIFRGMDVQDIMKKYTGLAGVPKDISELKPTDHSRKMKSHRNSRSKRDLMSVSYDYRDAFPKCKSLNSIREQTCQDCWAVSVASAFSDNYCIYTNDNIYFSARQLHLCTLPNGVGCSGGVIAKAADTILHYGITSGGDPKDPVEPLGCIPYDMSDNATGATCPTICTDGTTPIELIRGGGYNEYLHPSVDLIKSLLYQYGPLVAIMTVYPDFTAYKTGVFRSHNKTTSSKHGVRLIGYGTDPMTGEDYWLGANSWGTSWGEKGFFRIARGFDESDIESYALLISPRQAYT